VIKVCICLFLYIDFFCNVIASVELVPCCSFRLYNAAANNWTIFFAHMYRIRYTYLLLYAGMKMYWCEFVVIVVIVY